MKSTKEILDWIEIHTRRLESLNKNISLKEFDNPRIQEELEIFANLIKEGTLKQIKEWIIKE